MSSLRGRSLGGSLRQYVAVVVGSMLAVGTGLLLGGIRPFGPSSVKRPLSEPPNVIIILTNDQRWDTLWAMPKTRRWLIGRGVTFTNAFVTDPSCCLSRASILTGLGPS